MASRVGTPGTTSDERLLDAVNLFLIDGDLATTKTLAGALALASATARRVYLQARLAWFAGEPEQAESLATEAWARGDELSPDHLGSLAAILSQLHNLRADGLGAAEWAARALALGLPPDLADSTNAAQAFGLALVGRIEEALAVLEPVPSDPTLVRGYSHQLISRGALRVATDDLAGARRDLDLVCNASHAEVSPQRLLAMGALAEVEFRLGAWDASLAYAEHALSLAEDAEQLWVQGYLHVAAIMVCAGRGDWAPGGAAPGRRSAPSPSSSATSPRSRSARTPASTSPGAGRSPPRSSPARRSCSASAAGRRTSRGCCSGRCSTSARSSSSVAWTRPSARSGPSRRRPASGAASPGSPRWPGSAVSSPPRGATTRPPGPPSSPPSSWTRVASRPSTRRWGRRRSAGSCAGAGRPARPSSGWRTPGPGSTRSARGRSSAASSTSSPPAA